VDNGDIEVQYYATQDMLVDVLNQAISECNAEQVVQCHHEIACVARESVE
jgi:hypothetical protein